MLEIKYKKVDELIPYVNNTRTHSAEQLNQIAASIKEFGFTNPILIDEQSGIIAGHGRLLAAKKLKIDSVPTVELVGLSKAQKKAYVIADNKLALNAGWDENLLKLELQELKDLNFNLELTGFGDEEINNLVNEELYNYAEESSKPVNFAITYEIVFDDVEQQKNWYEFLKMLKIKYQELDTIGQKIDVFLKDNHGKI